MHIGGYQQPRADEWRLIWGAPNVSVKIFLFIRYIIVTSNEELCAFGMFEKQQDHLVWC